MSVNQNVAIIGASYLQLPLIQKAKELGYTTHVFAWAANDVGEFAADHFYPISIVDKELILEKCKEVEICGICSIASDLATVTVNYVAHHLGLVGNSLECTKKSTNKHMMRLAFEEGGDPSPKSMLVDDSTDLDSVEFSYPVIVKPTDRSGSRGIYKLSGPEQLRNAVADAIDASFEKKALVEEYAEGAEYSVEYVSHRGEHHFLALTKKITTGAPHFVETGHIEPADVPEAVLESVKAVVVHALDTLGVENGASHSEIKIDERGKIAIIEIGARMGGDCIGSDLVYYSTGVDFVKAVLEIACGKRPDLSVSGRPRPVCSKFIVTREDLEIYESLKQKHPEKIIREVFLDLDALEKMTDSSNRAGCYITWAD